jgi:cytoskeletal protein CcmA (bactofilin family)
MSVIKYIKKFFFKEDKKLEYQEELHISGLFVQNDIVALNDVWVTKSVTGNIYCAKNIVVSEGVQVIGNIYCRQCILEGKVKGDISASGMIEIKARAALNGNIITANLKVDPAAVLNGSVAIVNIKDARRIYSDIKLKIDNINHLSIDKGDSGVKLQHSDHVQNGNDGLSLNSKIPKINIQSEKAKPARSEDDKGSAGIKIQHSNHVQNGNDELNLNSKVPQIDIQPEKAKPARSEDSNNDKWW